MRIAKRNLQIEAKLPAFGRKLEALNAKLETISNVQKSKFSKRNQFLSDSGQQTQDPRQDEKTKPIYKN
jgi:hypothetical protein